MEVFHFLPSLSFHRGLTPYPSLHSWGRSVRGDSVAATEKDEKKKKKWGEKAFNHSSPLPAPVSHRRRLRERAAWMLQQQEGMLLVICYTFLFFFCKIDKTVKCYYSAVRPRDQKHWTYSHSRVCFVLAVAFVPQRQEYRTNTRQWKWREK